jgi:hypothetical protein
MYNVPVLSRNNRNVIIFLPKANFIEKRRFWPVSHWGDLVFLHNITSSLALFIKSLTIVVKAIQEGDEY